MLIDFESAWLDLKALIAQKSHHGQRDLLAEMARLEVQSRIEEGLPERALRLYGHEFFEAVVQARDSEQGRVPASEGAKDRALRGNSHHEFEENDHAPTIAGTAGRGSARGYSADSNGARRAAGTRS